MEEYECDCVFNSVSQDYLTACKIEYVVSASTVQLSTFDPSSIRLIIDVEEKWTGDLWRGDFSCKYIEEITQKTGSFKKFPVFVKMLF